MWNSGEPLSTIEVLDPEPPPKRSGRVLEVVLGFALLASVVGFACWQWYFQSRQEAEYDAGVRSASRYNWEAAQAHFAAASGYRDADKRDQSAATNIRKRDEQYNAALAGESNGNWAACLKSIQQVVEIQPGYKDAARIEQQASEQVYSDALSGTIALRTGADPAGLYFYGPDGWEWLAGSDSFSRIRGNTYAGWLLYDAPASASGGSEQDQLAPGGPGSGGLKGRHLLVTRLGDLDRVQQLSIDPGQFGSYVLSENGVWALPNISRNSFPGQSVIRTALVGFDQEAVRYESFSGSSAASISLQVSDGNAALMSLGLSGGRYLFAGWSGADASGVLTTTVTTLYMGRAGGAPDPLYRLKGGSFDSAQFSTDGRYVLLNQYVPIDETRERQSIMLLDSYGTNPPLALAETVAHLSEGNPLASKAWLTATYIQQPPFAGRILISQFDGNSYHLSIIDGGGEGAPLADLVVHDSRRLTWAVRSGKDNAILLVGQEQTYLFSGSKSHPVWLVAIARDGTIDQTTLSIDGLSQLDYAGITGDRAVLVASQVGGNSRSSTSALSLPIKLFNISGATPEKVYSQQGVPNLRGSYFRPGNSLDYGFGPTLLAYASNGDLHARLYDSSVDVTLEQHVSYLYSPALH